MPDRQDSNEDRLLANARKGDHEAFGELFKQYANQVYRFLYARLDDRRDAEDLTEEVFLRVWRFMPRYRQQGATFRSFLFRVARNALVDHYRKASRHTEVPLHDDHGQHDAQDLEKELANDIELREMIAMLAGLREDYCMVLSLRFLAGLSTEETAEVMERSAGAVRVLQMRALIALRKRMQEKG